jgi:dipicolinate synthase subunit A
MDKILILGGDLRNLYLYDLLKNTGKDIQLIGFDMIDPQHSLSEIKIKSAKTIIAPIPFSTDGRTLYMPNNQQQLFIDHFNLLLNKEVTVVSNAGKEYQTSSNAKYFNVLTNERFVQKTNIATVEGIIEILIRESTITIHNAHILILGMGRIGSRLSFILHQMGAVITIATKDEKESGLAFAAGYKVDTFEALPTTISDYAFIINTVPFPYVTAEVLKQISKKTLFLDVASFPGSIKEEDKKDVPFKLLEIHGIPGKTAPLTMANNLFDELLQNGIIQDVH